MRNITSLFYLLNDKGGALEPVVKTTVEKHSFAFFPFKGQKDLVEFSPMGNIPSRIEHLWANFHF